MNSGGHQLFRIEVKRGQSQVTFGKSEHLVRLNSKGRKHKKDNTDKIYQTELQAKSLQFFFQYPTFKKTNLPAVGQESRLLILFFFGEICSSYSILPSFSSDVCIIFGYLIRPVNLAW